jgi:hypothetical protein
LRESGPVEGTAVLAEPPLLSHPAHGEAQRPYISNCSTAAWPSTTRQSTGRTDRTEEGPKIL